MGAPWAEVDVRGAQSRVPAALRVAEVKTLGVAPPGAVVSLEPNLGFLSLFWHRAWTSPMGGLRAGASPELWTCGASQPRPPAARQNNNASSHGHNGQGSLEIQKLRAFT